MKSFSLYSASGENAEDQIKGQQEKGCVALITHSDAGPGIWAVMTWGADWFHRFRNGNIDDLEK